MAVSRAGSCAGPSLSLLLSPITRYSVPARCTCYALYSNDAKKEKPTGKLSQWFSIQYEKYETVYLNALRRFPFLYKVTTVFVKGTKQFYRDAKEGYQVRKKIRSGTPYPDLTWQEMYAVRKLIKDGRRILPTLILLSMPIPFWFYVILPLLYLFPRYLLTPQFYQPEQRVKFSHINHYRKVQQHDILLKYLDEKSSKLYDPKMAEDVKVLFTKINSRKQPNVDNLLVISDLFAGRFSLRFLPRSQLVNLCKVYSMWPYLQPANYLRKRLNSNIGQMHYMDIAIQKVGLDSLSLEDLQKICFERGLDSTEAKRDELTQWLADWIHISTHIRAAENALLLYSGILLVANHPTNQHHKKYIDK
ncbi:LETM1 domain-containing protein 1-like [Glandiceps talaboti]